MRTALAVLALAGLSACEAEPSESGDRPAIEATSAALSFNGSDYSSEAAKLAHGKRLAIVLDCTGCHGANLQGANVTKDDPKYGDMNAPNITLLLAKYSDADFDRLIRHGVPKDGREFWFMPVESLQFLSDVDLAALISYTRTFEPAGEQLPPIRKGKGFYEDLERGFSNSRAQVARYRAKPPVNLGTQHQRGRWLAQVNCTACHNGELQGYKGFTPDLDIAGAYSKVELTRLLTTGEGKTKKNLGMMSEMGANQFSKLTSAEREALVDYVLARAHRPQ